MSRVHDALRKAQQLAMGQQADALLADSETTLPEPAIAATVAISPELRQVAKPVYTPPPPTASAPVASPMSSSVAVEEPPSAPPVASSIEAPPAPYVHIRSATEIVGPTLAPALTEIQGILTRIEEVAFNPSPDSHLIDAARPHEAPTEEFRTLRTRLNHLQSLQPIHSVVVTSPSPAEGKSLGAVNLALAESQLAGNATLLCDFDFRRPIVHTLFQLDRSPGITDYLLGKARLDEVIKKIAGTNLYVMPAGQAVINPLELLNLKQVKDLLQSLPKAFNWVILDSPPLLFAADASLLGTFCDGTILVVRMGVTTVDSVTRAMNSLCENNVLGIIANGARKGELYSKYTYYHSYYYSKPD